MQPLLIVLGGFALWVVCFMVVLSALDMIPRGNVMYWPGKVATLGVWYWITESVVRGILR